MKEISLQKVHKKILEIRDKLKSLSYPYFTYHVFDYAYDPFWEYICRYGKNEKKNIFLGINPGPFGMMQNGIPFGAMSIVKDWLSIKAPIKTPQIQHPMRVIKGWKETREEESGARLWGLAKKVFVNPENFFKENFVLNYCPLGFIDEVGKNVTPDKLPQELREQVEKICDNFLSFFVEIYKPDLILGVGRYAEKQAQKINSLNLKVVYLPHPSPLNPQSYQLWIKNEGELMLEKLQSQGIWAF